MIETTPHGALTGRVLVVEDDPLLSTLVGQYLRRAGHDVDVADTVGAALDRTLDHAYDLVLSDLHLPDGSGTELAAQVLATSSTAVVMVTGDDDTRLATELLSQGAHGYLLKPVSENQLLITVQSALRRVALRRENLAYTSRLESMVDQRTAELRASVERLSAAERSREHFVANCSHELRTPLTPILGWSAMLRRPDLPPEQATRAVDIIERNAKRLLGVVDSLLTVAGSSPDVTLREVPVRELFSDVVDGVLERPVIVDVPRDADVLRTDRARIVAALDHVLDNAVKFSPAGSPIAITARRAGSTMVIDVRDHGRGVAPADRDRVFEAFEQGDGSSTRDVGGLGLGLFITRQLITDVGGHVQLADPPGRGTIVRITLPLTPGTTLSAPARRVPAVPQEVSA